MSVNGILRTSYLILKHIPKRLGQLRIKKCNGTNESITDLIVVGLGGFSRDTIIPNQRGNIVGFVTRNPKRDKWFSVLYGLKMFASIEDAQKAGYKKFYVTVNAPTARVVPKDTGDCTFYCEKPLFKTSKELDKFLAGKQNIKMVMLKTEDDYTGHLFYFKPENSPEWLFNTGIHYIWDLVKDGADIATVNGNWMRGEIFNTNKRRFVFDVERTEVESKPKAGKKEISDFLCSKKHIYDRSEIPKLYKALLQIADKYAGNTRNS